MTLGPLSFLTLVDSGSAASTTSSAARATTARGEALAAVRQFQGLAGLDEVRPVWERLSAPWASPMQSPAWIRAWAEVYGTGADLEFLVAGDGPSAAVAPLVRSRRGGMRFELAGPDNLVEAMDFLYQESASVPALARALVRTRMPLRFWRIPSDSPAVPALLDAYRGRAVVRTEAAQACPSLPLDETWSDPLSHLDAHRRQNVRRARRIAEGLGTVTTEILSPRPDEVGRLLDEAYTVEAAGWKSREGSPLVRDKLLGEFFRRYGSAAAAVGEFRVCFLRIGGRPAAMKLAATNGNRFWLLGMGFSDEFERCSPGTLLLMDTLAYAARSGLRSYEFLGADEPWVRALGPVQRECVSIRTYPLGVYGFMALAWDGSDRARGRARKARAWVDRTSLDVQHHLARAYSAGPSAEDGVRMAESLSALGYRGIVGYMNFDKEDPRVVARYHLAALEAIRARRFDCYVSIKAPALEFQRHLIREIVESGAKVGVRVHFDSLSADDVDRTFDTIRVMQTFHAELGTTLPARWKRSVKDADRAVDLGLPVRVIKGEWVDRRERERKPLEGYLEIVDRVAGRVPRVGVATHNPTLARKAIRRLSAAGTPCEIEVVRGYPIRRVLPVAVQEGVPIRAYVPFGNLAFPYTWGQVVRRPRIVVWAVRDFFRGGTSVVPADPRAGVRAGPTH
jgi:CelD/BcsL family acetyltransferase involved in cellulose biosynthesis